MNTVLEPAPKCQIAADGSHIILGDWSNSPSSTDPRKGTYPTNSQLGQSKLGQNSALSNAISSNLSQNQS